MYLPQTRVSHQQQGSYIIWMLIFIPVIFGLVGLSIDAAFALSEKNRVQAAADAAAIAAALTFNNGGSFNEVQKAAESALDDYGLTGTVTVGDSKTHTPTKDQSDYFCLGCPGYKDEHLGVTVTAPSPLFVNKWYQDDACGNDCINLTAHAVARAAKPGHEEPCPGIYANSGGKATNLLHGSDFTVLGGGIYIEGPEGNSLFGSSKGADRAILSAKDQWIELQGGAATAPKSVDYDPTPTDLSQDRQTPDPAPPGLVNYNNCILKAGDFQCGCDSKDKCTDPVKRPSPTAEKTLTAGNYIGGLKIIDTPDAIFAPVGSTMEEQSLLKNLYFKMTSGNLKIENSTVSGENIIIDARKDAPDNSDLLIELDNSHITALARFYANSYYLKNTSDITVTVYMGDQDSEGEYLVCGAKPSTSALALLH